MSQFDLASRVGVSARTIGAWERGESVSRNRLALLREVLGFTGDDDASDPLRSASEADLLRELLRRATLRERGTG